VIEERTVYVNGKFVPWNQAQTHLMSHSFGRGSAIFEVFALHDTIQGPAVFRLDEHIERFFRSAALINMKLPISREKLQEAVFATLKENKLRQAEIKIFGFYSQIKIEITPPESEADVAIVAVDPFQDFEPHKVPFERGIAICISKWRKLDPETVPIEAKVAANYLNGVMMMTEAKKRGFENAVMLDTQGFIAEGAVHSIFLVKNNRLMTPSLRTILSSITRKSILEAAQVLGIEAYEGDLRPSLFNEAEEIFLSNTPTKVIPVRQIEDRVLPYVPGPITRKVDGLLKEIVSGRDKRFNHWLFPLR
jgi:branched-chain amino acid aminotransferase